MNPFIVMGRTEEPPRTWAFWKGLILELGRDRTVCLTGESPLYLVEAVTKGPVAFTVLVY